MGSGEFPVFGVSARPRYRHREKEQESVKELLYETWISYTSLISLPAAAKTGEAIDPVFFR